MKAVLLALLLLGVLLSAALVQGEGDRLRTRRDAKPHFDEIQDDEDDEPADEENSEDVVDVAAVEDGHNPCIDKVCRRGEICQVVNRQRAKCVCFPQCEELAPEDTRYQVCSKRNVTYQSDCELDRDHCLCRRRLEGCSRPNSGKVRLDYYGPCQAITPCTEREFKEFPGRMREWLYIVMKQLAQRAEIPDYLDMLDKARHEGNHSHAVIWKFCDLDVDPHDRFVTRRELLYTVQSLKAMEHCLVPFLDKCDSNSDAKITLVEWGECLGLEKDYIKDECKAIRKTSERKKE